MPTEANALNASTVGIVGNTGTSFTGTAATSHNVLVGGSTSSTLNNVPPSATIGIPLVSSGVTSDPSFTTAVVAGGGTGITSATSYAPICGGTTTTGALQSASTGISTVGFVLTSTGASSLPTWQASGGGGGGISTIDGDTGSATGATVTFTTVNSGSSPSYSATGSTVSLQLSDSNHNTLIGELTGLGGITGTDNTSIGYNCLSSLTSGNVNVAIGRNALESVTSSTANIGIGENSLSSIDTDGTSHLAIGADALSNYHGTSPTGGGNIAIGNAALGTFGTGGGNLCVGHNSAPNLANPTGPALRNTLIGNLTGANLTSTESDNIYLGYGINGTGGESNVLRIANGTGTSAGAVNSTFIGGISGISVTGSAVLVSASNQLGVTVSSRRFKENINDMKDVSSSIYNLRPVTYNPKGDPSTLCTGLIAEEVDSVMPSLVHYDEKGAPLTVKYHDLPALLLNEIKKLKEEVENLKKQVYT